MFSTGIDLFEGKEMLWSNGDDISLTILLYDFGLYNNYLGNYSVPKEDEGRRASTMTRKA